MHLSKIHYVQNEGADQEWGFVECPFNDINLIVGRNSAGKTKTINVIFNVAKRLIGRQRAQLSPHNVMFEFISGEDTLTYEMTAGINSIEHEKLTRNSEVLFERGVDGKGQILAIELGKKIQFEVPKNLLVLTAKRDILQHPFLEPIYKWTGNLRIFRFGTDLKKSNLVLNVPQQGGIVDNTGEFNPLPLLKKAIQVYGQKFLSELIAAMNAIAFPVESVSIGPPVSVQVAGALPGQPECILFQERGIQSKFDQFDMSQGMFRTFGLLMYCLYLKFVNTPSTVLIDDIGEGLDFERGTQLIKTIEEIAKESQLQIIMTTNDQFIMNAVALKNWLILVREGQNIRFVNYQNSKGRFDDFGSLGLNNFDFFSGQFWKESKTDG